MFLCSSLLSERLNQLQFIVYNLSPIDVQYLNMLSSFECSIARVWKRKPEFLFVMRNDIISQTSKVARLKE